MTGDVFDFDELYGPDELRRMGLRDVAGSLTSRPVLRPWRRRSVAGVIWAGLTIGPRDSTTGAAREPAPVVRLVDG